MLRIVSVGLQKAHLRMNLDREDGQALVEYALILGLISIVAVVALGVIGVNVTDKLNFVSSNI